MKITNEFLKEKSACIEGFEWVNECGIVDLEHTDFLNYLLTHNHFDYANWLITKLLDKDNLVRYAIFAAEQVLDAYEKQYPEDDRPRKVNEAPKEYLKTHSTAAVHAAHAVAYAVADAAYAAHAVAYAVAAVHAADAAYAAELKTKMINYGIQLIGEQNGN